MISLTAEEVQQLTDPELRKELEDRGTPVGPITDFTRNLLKKILLRKLGLLVDGDEEPSSERSDGWASQAVESKAGAADDMAPAAVYAFFGVYLPPDFDNKPDSPELKPVYTDKAECLAAIKKHKGMRFKTFRSYDDAFHFSKVGPQFNVSVIDQQDATDSGGSNSGVDMNNLEKSTYRGPSSQDRVKFRKTIESGDLASFNAYVLANPRYLVSNSDSPAILKEGCRYNALHVACVSGRDDMCAAILQHVSTPRLFQLLYPEDTPDTSERRQQFLLDLYLNMPDKGLNETPLHVACKLGKLACVKLLTAQAACDKERLNKYGHTPREVVCRRYTAADPSSLQATRTAILELLEPLYYVPVLRDSSFTLPPTVGEPWSPSVGGSQFSPPEFAGDSFNASLSFLNNSTLNNSNNSLFNTSLGTSALDSSVLRAAGVESPSRGHRLALASPLTCTRKVEAFLGPLPLWKAEAVRKQWRKVARAPPPGLHPLYPTSLLPPPLTPPPPQQRAAPCATPSSPPRAAAAAVSSLACSTPLRAVEGPACSTPAQHRAIRLPDYQKGLEVIGRQLADEYKTNWFEYWDFMKAFVDLDTEEGKRRLEEHLKTQYAQMIAAEQTANLASLSEALSPVSAERAGRSRGEEEPGGREGPVSGSSNSSSSDRVTVLMAEPPSAAAAASCDASSASLAGTGSHAGVLSSPRTPSNNNSKNSSLGSLCRGLEAIRLNASLSPNAAYHYSPAAQRRYEELQNILQHDESRILDVVSSFSPSHLNLSTQSLDASLRASNWRLLSYVAQSCKVTARTLASVLEGLAQDLQTRTLVQLATVRMVKSRLAGEVLALHVVISRCCADKNRATANGVRLTKSGAAKRVSRRATAGDVPEGGSDGEMDVSEIEKSINEGGVSFIHGLVTVETLKLLSESLLPGELLCLLQLMKTLMANLGFIEIASSDEDDDEDDSRPRHNSRPPNNLSERRDQAMHIKCIVRMLERGLSIATNEGRDDRINRIPSTDELGKCECAWDNCCVTLAALAEYAATGGGGRAAGSSRKSKSKAANSKYKDAHSFLHQTVFGSGNKLLSSSSSATRKLCRSRSNPDITVSNDRSTDSAVAKHLAFDDETDGQVNTNEKAAHRRDAQPGGASDVPTHSGQSGTRGCSDVRTNTKVKEAEHRLIVKTQPDNNKDALTLVDNNEKEKMGTSATSASNSERKGNVEVDREEEDDGEDNDSFATAMSSVNSSLATPDETKEVYINGPTPSKVDLDVLVALERPHLSLHDLETKFPHLAQWHQLLQDRLHQLQEAEAHQLHDAVDGTPAAAGGAVNTQTGPENIRQLASMFDSPYCHRPRRPPLMEPLAASSPHPAAAAPRRLQL